MLYLAFYPRLSHDLTQCWFKFAAILQKRVIKETLILPHGIKSTLEEDDTGFSESESLRTVIFPEGLKIIGGFHSCPTLTEVILPEGLEVIESHAFCGCEAISSIRLPASVEYISGSSFAGCNITSYEVDEGNSYYTAIDGVIYTSQGWCLR